MVFDFCAGSNSIISPLDFLPPFMNKKKPQGFQVDFFKQKLTEHEIHLHALAAVTL